MFFSLRLSPLPRRNQQVSEYARHTLKPTLMVIWISALSDACAWSKSSTAPLMEHYLMVGSLTTSRYLSHEKVMDAMFFRWCYQVMLLST